MPATYNVAVDWSGNGTYADTGEDVTARTLLRSPLSIQYGRDQARSLAPMSAGRASFDLNNTSRDYCVEVDAEALVLGRGWCKHGEIEAGDRILAYDPADDSIRWEAIESINHFHWKGDLIRWRSISIDVATTPNHQWWTVGTSGRSRYTPRFRTTQEVSGHQLYVKIGGGTPACFPDKATYSDDFVELLGWVFTEGWFETGASLKERFCGCGAPARNVCGKPICDGCAQRPLSRHARSRPLRAGRYTRTGFGQSLSANPKKVARIRELIERLVAVGHNIAEHQYRSGSSVMSTWRFAGELDLKVREALPDKKLTIELLSKLTLDQAELLLDVLILGDGHVTPAGYRQFYQKDRQQLGVVAMLCAMLGIRTSVKDSSNNSGCGTLTLCSSNRLSGKGVNAHPEPYDGVVWCPRVRTGVFLARSHGRTFWTGNSPENGSSPLAGNVLPGRGVRIQATLSAVTYTLFQGHLDDFDVLPNYEERSVQLTAVDALAKLKGVTISTDLHQGLRTGDAINLVLDAAGWSPTARDIDPGVTTIRWWWEERTDAFSAVEKLINSEGPPSLVTVSADGQFVFRDRHHRLLRTESTTSQATFRDTGTEPVLTAPLVYDQGWRDVINSVTFSVDERDPEPDLTAVWTSDRIYQISDGETLVIRAETTDPFFGAVVPVAGTDYQLTSGSVTVTLSRTQGASATIFVKATGGPAQILGLALRAYPVVVRRTIQVHVEDSTSIGTPEQPRYGRRSWPNDAPWAGVHDAEAIGNLILAQRAERLPIVSVKLVSANDTRLTQMLSRDLSDRVTIVDAETGLNGAFYIEQIQHVISEGLIHETVFGCEKVPAVPTGLFKFDVAGAGFNDGKFGGTGLDDPNTIFLFDVAGRGFNDAVFAT